MKKKLWLTYAWVDNEENDVAFVAQELRRKGLEVLVDRTQLVAGRRLWPQIEAGICDPTQSDAWAIYATQNSLQSQPCQEELAYALDRALSNRGVDFPLIGIFPGHLDKALVPKALATRLYVSLSDPEALDRVVGGTLGFRPAQRQSSLSADVFRWHQVQTGRVLEWRRRIDTIGPVCIVVPTDRQTVAVEPIAFNGIPNKPLAGGAVYMEQATGHLLDGRPGKIMTFPNYNVSPIQSAYFYHIDSLEFYLGIRDGEKIYFHFHRTSEGTEVLTP